MSWLLITIISYLLFAAANVGDKLMVSKYKTEPVAYAFYVGILGILTLVLIPLGVIIPPLSQVFWSFLAGVSFVMALYFMYKALNSGETTKAITIMGGSSPIFTFIFSLFFLKENLSLNQALAFVLLVAAIIVISFEAKKKREEKKSGLVMWALISGLVFAISYVLTKYVYLNQPFISGFVWIRVGGFLTALVFLLVPKNRKIIKTDYQRPKTQKGPLLLVIQVLGGIGVLGQNYAFSLASASLVNALQAIQYAFVFILANLLGLKIPALKERLNFKLILQKIIAIILIAICLYFLTL